jgi:hypothetical protein
MAVTAMGLNFDKFKSRGLGEKHAAVTETISAFV